MIILNDAGLNATIFLLVYSKSASGLMIFLLAACLPKTLTSQTQDVEIMIRATAKITTRTTCQCILSFLIKPLYVLAYLIQAIHPGQNRKY
jgi:hypothetical protein